MLGHCINPDCCAPLHSFSEGRLYQFEIVSISITANDSAATWFDEKPERQAVHYWLCGRCARTMNLRLEPLRGLQVVPLLPGQEASEAGEEAAEGDRRLADNEFRQANRC
jgi:hypothetical protein